MAHGQPEPCEILERVLLLERKQGFADRAAVGGLNRFVRAQVERNASTSSGDILLAVENALHDYAALNPIERERTVSLALQVLQSGRAAGPAPTAAPASRRHSPSSVPRPRQQKPRVESDVKHRQISLDDPVTVLRGFGTETSEALSRLGVTTLRDLLYFFPRTHYDYTDQRSISRLRFGEKTTLVGTVRGVRTGKTPRGISITTATIEDQTGRVAVRWFNQPYIAKNLREGVRVAITGQPELFNGNVSFQPRDYEIIRDDDLTHAARLVPIYPLTRGLFQKSLRRLMYGAVREIVSEVDEFLPEPDRLRLGLPDLAESLRQYHFPADVERKEAAQLRLAFDELLVVQLGLLIRKRAWQVPEPDIAIPASPDVTTSFQQSLPFPLTRAQSRVLAEVLGDMARPFPMSRLIQGDVGSGKTVVAAGALLHARRAGKQAVVMAPTEILAEQHFQTFEHLLGGFGVRCGLLTGSLPKGVRKRVLAGVAACEVDVLIGTHALIQEGVEFPELGLVITDEQHRFGVEQRSMLRDKGKHPHTLSMTATPIPRTLAMTIYGDLDVSVIDEMPPGRQAPITTRVAAPREAYDRIREQIAKGHQAFVVCPVIEESADSDMRSVLAEHKELRSLIFSDLRVGLLHGRMKAAEKEAVLHGFRDGDYGILVATSVVEVGIDIPNATVMLIRDAHRFGLAQLHQLRGRVGRGGDQAYCLLLSSAEGEQSNSRLDALAFSNNGFDLAEQDLQIRGPGEFWGTRQSGLPELKVATLGDVRTVEMARSYALSLLDSDADLASDEHRPLAEEVQRFWSRSADLG